LRTAHGVFICYWDGTVHYVLYLAMAGAIHRRKRYRNLGLYWLGSFIMSILVFLPGNLLGKDWTLKDPVSSGWVTVLRLKGS